MYILLYLLTLVPSVISLTTEIQYNLVHSGTYMFSTGMNETYIISKYDNLDQCKKMCDKNSLCLGITSYSNNSIECNLLSNLGDTMSTSLNISSYRKFTRYYDNDKHSIYGTVITSGNKYNFIDTDIYIDLNHNGRHDPGEPITTSYKGNFNFTQLHEGKYLIREITPPECTQLYPGAWGNYHTIDGDGYVDNIVLIHKHNHPMSGGFINKSGEGSLPTRPRIRARHMDHSIPYTTPTTRLPPTYDETPDITTNISDFILGESSDRYLTFYPDDEIIMSFVDETIINTNGTDIFINTYNNSSTHAHVSVSYDGINFTYIGILNNTHKEFDLSIVNYTAHVSYIRLHFFGEKDGINIVTIRGATDSIYSPSFGYYIKIPLKKSKNYVSFLNDCHYHYHCIVHCFLGNINMNDSYSCMSGCNLFKSSYICECENYVKLNINYTSEFSIEKCYEGCEYKMNQFFFPDYKVYKNSIGSSKGQHSINSINMDYCNARGNTKCLSNIRDICRKKDVCKSISIDNNNIVNYNNIERNHHHNSYLIVKNQHLGSGGLDYNTTSTSSSSTTTSSTSSSSTTTSSTSSSSTTTSSTSGSTSTTTSGTGTNSTTTSGTGTNSTTTSGTGTNSTTTSGTGTNSTTTSSSYTSYINDNPEKNKDNDKDNKDEKIKIIAIICGVLACLVGSIIIYTFMCCKNLDTKQPLQPDNRMAVSFDNPVYNTTDQRSLYHETLPGEPIEDEFDPDKDYVEIK